MNTVFLDLPNEILGLITSHLIGGVWNNDVRDFLSLTSTCRRLHGLSREEKYWRKMARRRDPASEKPSDVQTWFDYCQQIYLMRTILPDDVLQTVSRYDDGYFCTVEKILLWPDKIRIFIDERGDNSLGTIQDPMYTKITFQDPSTPGFTQNHRIVPSESQFSIQDPQSQYLGYLDFRLHLTLGHVGKVLVFQYGTGGYSAAQLLLLDQRLIDKYHLHPLLPKRSTAE